MRTLKKHNTLPAVCFTLAALVGLSWTQPIFAAAYKVVVHETNPVSSMPRKDVSDLFLKKKTKWDHGVKVEPVDLVDPESLREAFCEGVHKRSVQGMKSYWNTQIFSGTASPPPQVETEAAVMEYIKTHPGAIGYISSAGKVGDGVKVIKVTD